MNKKIIARLEDNSFVTLFNRDNPDFNTVSDCYHIPDIPDELSILFDPDRSIEDEEWFYVEPDTSQKENMINPYIHTLENIDTINPIAAENYKDIRAICLVDIDDGNEKIILTRVYPRFYTMSKKILKWDAGPSMKEQSQSVDFTASIDAFWQGDRLYFKSYKIIASLFEHIDEFYRSATDEERDSFLAKDMFQCENNNISVRPRNLRKIASVLDKIDWDNESTRAEYIAYAREHPVSGVRINDEGQIIIESNKDITQTLAVLEERYYKTPITGEEREALSITKLD